MNQPLEAVSNTPQARSLWGGRYQVFEAIGTGAMATVYHGYDPIVGRPVAIKNIHPHLASSRTFVSALQREACAGGGVSHPNVACTYDFRSDPATGTCFVVMERLQDRSLENVIAGEPRPPLDWTLQIVAQTLAALAAIHDRGIVHRDVKPDNIMIERIVDDDGRAADQVKLCDFGIARVPGVHLRGDDGRPLTFHGLPCGTPGYVAPEQVAGKRIDHRADIYAVGVMLEEMVTGHHPFQYDATCPAPDAALTRPAPRHVSVLPPGIDPALERVIRRATAESPDDRYGSARDMRSDLLALVPRARRVTYAPPLERTLTSNPFEGDEASRVRPRPKAGQQEESEVEALERRLKSRPTWPFALAACSALAAASSIAWPDEAMAALRFAEHGLRAMPGALVKLSETVGALTGW